MRVHSVAGFAWKHVPVLRLVKDNWEKKIGILAKRGRKGPINCLLGGLRVNTQRGAARLGFGEGRPTHKLSSRRVDRKRRGSSITAKPKNRFGTDKIVATGGTSLQMNLSNC